MLKYASMNPIKRLIETTMKLLNRNNRVTIASILLLLHPILDLDYLVYGILDPLGIPLPSTVLHFVIIPMFILMVFMFEEMNKKKILILFGLYGSIVLGYFIVHHFYVKDLFEQLYLTNRYVYSMTTELRYILTLIIPFGLIYAFYRIEFTPTIIRKIILLTSILLSVPIFLSNLFVFGPSTYVGNTMANFLTWFGDIYKHYHPRQLASQFYFSEGNTTGILMFGLYPIVIHYYFEAKKRQNWILGLILIQGIAMFALATRVATYGVPLMLGAMLASYVVLALLKHHRFEWKPFFLLSSVFIVLLTIFPHTPAVVNQSIDAQNDGLVLNEDYQRVEAKDYIASQNLIPGTAEYNYFYQYMFEQYYFLLTIPSIYYEWYYPYEIDPKFYVDLIFNYELYQRASGRQFEKIFFDYKWSTLSTTQKWFGFGYSRFMMGSIVLEQDFMQQKYTLGYLGQALLTFPWLILLASIVVMMVMRLKQHLNLFTISMGLALSGMFFSAYLSGHVLDQFFTTSFMALFMALLLKNAVKAIK